METTSSESSERLTVYRTTSSGETVAYGPACTMGVGPVEVMRWVAPEFGSGGQWEPRTEQVVRLGQPFVSDGVEMVYGYLARHYLTPDEVRTSLSEAKKLVREGSAPCTRCAERPAVTRSQDELGRWAPALCAACRDAR